MLCFYHCVRYARIRFFTDTYFPVCKQNFGSLILYLYVKMRVTGSPYFGISYEVYFVEINFYKNLLIIGLNFLRKNLSYTFKKKIKYIWTSVIIFSFVMIFFLKKCSVCCTFCFLWKRIMVRYMLQEHSLETHHVYSTLKRRGNNRFHVVSTWKTRGVFVGL